MRNVLLIIVLLAISAGPLHAVQSVIIDSGGYACMGDDRSRKETEKAAMQDARRNAGEEAVTYIKTETRVEDGILQKDLVNAYANARVKMVQELSREWYKDPAAGDCFRVKLKLEVLPDEKAMASLAKNNQEELLAGPQAPLAIKLWTIRKKYRAGERIEVFLKGNRPFYGKIVYEDASGNLIQLLPNPYRKNNYFNGGTVYSLPSGEDRFSMEVGPPYGKEKITLYASTAPLGDLRVKPNSGVYIISDKSDAVPAGARGINLIPESSDKGREFQNKPVAAEFAEGSWQLTTSAK